VSLEDLANIGEFVGAVVVVISLAYLAVQIRQNTASLRTENAARILDRVSNMQSRLADSEELMVLHAKGVLDVGSLTPQERIRLTWWLYEAFGVFEFLFHQRRTGAVPDDAWERWSATIAWWVSFPGVRAWWAARPAPFSSGFSDYVDRLIEEGGFDQEAAARWQHFVRGDAAVRPAFTDPS